MILHVRQVFQNRKMTEFKESVRENKKIPICDFLFSRRHRSWKISPGVQIWFETFPCTHVHWKLKTPSMINRDAQHHGKKIFVKLKCVGRLEETKTIFQRVFRHVNNSSVPCRLTVQRCSTETFVKATRVTVSTFDFEVPQKIGKLWISKSFDR